MDEVQWVLGAVQSSSGLFESHVKLPEIYKYETMGIKLYVD